VRATALCGNRQATWHLDFILSPMILITRTNVLPNAVDNIWWFSKTPCTCAATVPAQVHRLYDFIEAPMILNTSK
jgi:hypothetical protein